MASKPKELKVQTPAEIEAERQIRYTKKEKKGKKKEGKEEKKKRVVIREVTLRKLCRLRYKERMMIYDAMEQFPEIPLGRQEDTWNRCELHILPWCDSLEDIQTYILDPSHRKKFSQSFCGEKFAVERDANLMGYKKKAFDEMWATFKTECERLQLIDEEERLKKREAEALAHFKSFEPCQFIVADAAQGLFNNPQVHQVFSFPTAEAFTGHVMEQPRSRWNKRLPVTFFTVPSTGGQGEKHTFEFESEH